MFSRNFIKQQWGLGLATAVSLLAYGGLVRLQYQYGTLRAEFIPQTIFWYLLAFAAFVGALVWAEKRAVSLRWIWATAVIFRLLLLFTVPTLSDDVYRYLWDGYVATEGVSPYAYAIDSPELDYLDIPQRALANNSWMASPYMPVAQWVFFSAALVFPLQPVFLQLLLIIFDLLSAFLIARLLTLARLPAHRIMLYLWNPLVVVEIAHGAHIDAWMILLTLTAVAFTLQPAFTQSKTSQIGAPLFLALATLTKILPILMLPVLFWRWRWRQFLLYGLVMAALLLPAGLRAGWGLTGDLDGAGLFGALRIYGSYWRFNSGVVYWLEAWLAENGLTYALAIAKAISLVGMILVLVIVWLLARRFTSVRATLRLTAVSFMAYLIFTPTVHPWYSLIVLAFVPFWAPSQTESRWLWLAVAPWLYLSGTLVFSYLTYIDPLDFRELEWVRQIEWLPTLALLLVFLCWAAVKWLPPRTEK